MLKIQNLGHKKGKTSSEVTPQVRSELVWSSSEFFPFIPAHLYLLPVTFSKFSVFLPRSPEAYEPPGNPQPREPLSFTSKHPPMHSGALNAQNLLPSATLYMTRSRMSLDARFHTFLPTPRPLSALNLFMSECFNHFPLITSGIY